MSLQLLPICQCQRGCDEQKCYDDREDESAGHSLQHFLFSLILFCTNQHLLSEQVVTRQSGQRMAHGARCVLLQFMVCHDTTSFSKESLIDSDIHADGIFLRPAASQKPRNSAVIPSVLFLAGRKNLLVIAKTSLNQWFPNNTLSFLRTRFNRFDTDGCLIAKTLVTSSPERFWK